MNRLINADYVFLEIFVWMEKPYFSLCMKSFFFCNCSWIRTPIRPLFGNNGSSPLVRPPLSAMKKWPAKRGNLSWLEWHNYLVVIYYLRRVASLDGDNLVVIYYLRRVVSLEWHNLVVIYYLRRVASLEWHNLVVIYYLRRVASLDGDNLVVIYYLRRVASLEWHNLVVIYYLRRVASLEWHNLVVIYYLRRVASLDGDNLVVIYYLRRVASLEWHNLVVIYYLRKVAFCGSCLIRGWLLYSNFLLFVVAKIYSSFKTLCSRIFDILLNLDFLSHWIISIFSFHLLNFYNACH